jgi:hypothetical protein
MKYFLLVMHDNVKIKMKRKHETLSGGPLTLGSKLAPTLGDH